MAVAGSLPRINGDGPRDGICVGGRLRVFLSTSLGTAFDPAVCRPNDIVADGTWRD
jgi:hypothetical protein